MPAAAAYPGGRPPMQQRPTTTLVLVSIIAAGALVVMTQLEERSARAARGSSPPSADAPADDRRTLAAGDGTRRPIPIEIAPETPPTTTGGSASLSTAAALAGIFELAERLGPALDLVRPDPDPAVLQALRDLVEAGGLTTADLRGASETFARGDARRVALALAAAWAADQGPAADAWLTALGTDRAAESVGAEQESLAAVIALGIAGRSAALETTAADLIEAARNPESEGFPGLTRIRTWFALAELPRYGGVATDLDRWIEGTGDQHRVNSELWALAVRTDPDRFGPTAVEAARTGVVGARAGIESLTGPEHVDRLAALLTPAPGDPNALWAERAAARALAACGNAPSRRALVQALERAGEVERELLVEALYTWREPAEPERVFASQLQLIAALESDADAAGRIADDLDRRLAQWMPRRTPASERRLLDALARVESELAQVPLARERILRWRSALDSVARD